MRYAIYQGFSAQAVHSKPFRGAIEELKWDQCDSSFRGGCYLDVDKMSWLNHKIIGASEKPLNPNNPWPPSDRNDMDKICRAAFMCLDQQLFFFWTSKYSSRDARRNHKDWIDSCPVKIKTHCDTSHLPLQEWQLTKSWCNLTFIRDKVLFWKWITGRTVD